jgi:hypothetical protein
MDFSASSRRFAHLSETMEQINRTFGHDNLCGVKDKSVLTNMRNVNHNILLYKMVFGKKFLEGRLVTRTLEKYL